MPSAPIPDNYLKNIPLGKSAEEMLKPMLVLSDDRGRLAAYALTLTALNKELTVERDEHKTAGFAAMEERDEYINQVDDLVADNRKLRAVLQLLTRMLWTQDSVPFRETFRSIVSRVLTTQEIDDALAEPPRIAAAALAGKEPA